MFKLYSFLSNCIAFFSKTGDPSNYKCRWFDRRQTCSFDNLHHRCIEISNLQIWCRQALTTLCQFATSALNCLLSLPSAGKLSLPRWRKLRQRFCQWMTMFRSNRCSQTDGKSPVHLQRKPCDSQRRQALYQQARCWLELILGTLLWRRWCTWGQSQDSTHSSNRTQ